MVPVELRLAVLWVALMLTYLLGDVLRLYAGDFDPATQKADLDWIWAALLMVVPIVMAVASVYLPLGWGRWVHVVVAALLWLLNAAGILSYAGLYDRVLIGFSLVLNVLVVVEAWRA